MKIEIKEIKIKDIINLKDRIDPSPQFQRGSVWKKPQNQLLIDSLLRDFDLPKFYFSNESIGGYDFSIVDGQQRLNAIYEFFLNGLKLGNPSEDIGGHNYNGLEFKDLTAGLKRSLKQRKLTFAIIKGASQDELRTLFARLQKGIQLNQAELRNAIGSGLGCRIHSIAEHHNFFKHSTIGDERFKHQDYLAHFFALVLYENQEDLKAPLLRKMYQEHMKVPPKQVFTNVNLVLDKLHEINIAASKQIRNKYGFVDLSWFLYKNIDRIDKIKPQKIAKKFTEFEELRISNNQEPESLIGTKDEELYKYILAFNNTPATKKNITTRSSVFNSYFK